MRDYRVYLKLLELIKIYKPTINMLHYLVYLYAYKYKLFWEAMSWEWELFGEHDVIYSPTLQNMVNALVRAGKVKLCRCSILTTDKCLDVRDCDKYVMRYSRTIMEAIEHASRRKSMEEDGVVAWF